MEVDITQVKRSMISHPIMHHGSQGSLKFFKVCEFEGENKGENGHKHPRAIEKACV